METRTLIVIMAKQPRIGETKTRLYPALSAQESIHLYQALLLDTILLVINQAWADLAVAFTPPDARHYFESITPAGTYLLPVQGENIGGCLVQAIGLSLGLGYTQVVALNSDGPSLPPHFLQQAALYLKESDLVLGPGDDGGYYLVGMRCLYKAIFEGIEWSTDRVLAQTLERAGRLGLKTSLTPGWYDVDTPDDLLRLQQDLKTLPPDQLPHSRRFLEGIELSSRTA
jgi:uncharacterized protein